ncbi:Uncharacterised protein [Vibrio cholerae]|nr:Uncharacterised protein [Vibrio cholerae]CSD10574.1 Uncharacterised protein [Vibrio cholerae]CSD41794.1 Uncharacterised protein [Vibrio cholerae]
MVDNALLLAGSHLGSTFCMRNLTVSEIIQKIKGSSGNYSDSIKKTSFA